MNSSIKTYGSYLLFILLGVGIGLSIAWFIANKSNVSIPIVQNYQAVKNAYVPRDYEIPYATGSLNVPHFLSAGMEGGTAPTKHMDIPTYKYVRNLMFNMYPSFPGGKEFTECIKDLDYTIGSDNITLDPLWRPACLEKIPEDRVFSTDNPGLIERYRLNITYSAFMKEDPSYCPSLLDISIKDSTGVKKSDEFESYIVCMALTTRNFRVLDGEYYKMEQALKNNTCNEYLNATTVTACKNHLNSKK